MSVISDPIPPPSSSLMAPNPIHLLLLLYASSLISSSLAQLQPSDDAFTSITVSQKGLEFIKDVLVIKAVSSAIPLQLPRIEKSIRIPFLGNVDMVLSNVTIYEIDVPDSYVKLGDEGVAIIASGTTCNLSMNWRYSYSSWLVPVAVSDQGHASVKVDGMEMGLTLGMDNYEGSLNLSLLDGGCLVRDISINLDGGASWLYQGMIDAFQAQISSAVENAISKKLDEGIVKLNSFVQALPKEIPVDDTASVNVTFVNDPLLSNSSMGFEINGLFTTNQNNSTPKHKYENYQLLHLCEDPPKMIGISLAVDVFSSASALYYNAEFMRWVVDKIPEKSLLNTAGWRFIIPQLYKKYPNDDMEMNISLSSPPVIKISEKDIDATVYADFILDVIHSDEVIPVACISLVIRGSGSVKIVQNNLAGSLKLNDFSMSLKWSNIGNLHIFLIQPVIWTVIETCMPYVNSHLAKGFPLPIVHGFTLENAEISASDSRITVCSDVSYAEAEADYLRQDHGM